LEPLLLSSNWNLDGDSLGSVDILHAVIGVTPEHVIALRGVTALLLSVQFHGCQDPWSLWTTAIGELGWAHVATILDGVSVVVLGACSLSELNETSWVRRLVINSILEAVVLVVGSQRSWQESTIILGGGEEDWVLG